MRCWPWLRRSRSGLRLKAGCPRPPRRRSSSCRKRTWPGRCTFPGSLPEVPAVDDLTGACTALAALSPPLADALPRDNAPADSRSVLSAGGVVNADVLHAMLTLAAEIPAARAAACDLAGEPWQPRPPLTCLRAIPRLRDRLQALSLPGAAVRLEDDVRRWTRPTKLALGLRTPDMPIGWDRPLQAEPSPLTALGAEGFLRDDMTIWWQHAATIWCPLCGASWPEATWAHLGHVLLRA